MCGEICLSMKTKIMSGLNGGVWGEMSKYKDDNFLGLNGSVCIAGLRNSGL